MPRIAFRLIPVLVVAVFMIAALGPADSAPIGEERGLVIDTGGPVTMAKCEPCHRDLNQIEDNPDLINFNHPVHFKRDIGCPVCHTVFPHQPGKLVKPTMSLCANCHRQKHGNQGQTASFNCGLCHPADFKLTPDDHETGGFDGSGHAKKAEVDAQPCLVCHSGSSCEKCHADEGIKTQRRFRWYGLWPVEQGAGEKIRIGPKVEMSTCQACHRDLSKWENPKLINFNHPVHFKREIACDNCHDGWPHAPDKIKRPQMTACAQCHRLDHGNQGQLVAAEDPDISGFCRLCHPSDMQLRPDWHTTEFVEGDHKRFARQDRGRCRMCHVQTFCDACHGTQIPHSPDWRSEHGRVAASLQDQGDNLSCFRCHRKDGPQTSHQSAPSCAKCHKAVVFPHPKPWAPQHGKTASVEGVDVCETCHVKENFCDKCHGGAPLPHPDNWVGQHRLFLRDESTEVCLTCHQQGQCEQCHSQHRIHNQWKMYDIGGTRFF